MAIQVVQQPGAISFAGDPIIAKVKTTLTGKTFLRVKLKCDVTVFRNSEEHTYSEPYSFEVAADGIAEFNVGSTIQTALARYIIQTANNGEMEQTMYAAKFKLTYKEAYIEGMTEIEEEEITSEEKEDMTNTNKKIDELVEQRNSILSEYAGGNKLVSQLIDLALLANGMLKGEALSQFIKRSVQMIG